MKRILSLLPLVAIVAVGCSGKSANPAPTTQPVAATDGAGAGKGGKARGRTDIRATSAAANADSRFGTAAGGR